MQKFPLLALSLLLYAGLDLTIEPGAQPWYHHETFNVQVMSGDVWQIHGGDIFMLFSFSLLFVEILRSTSSGTDSLINDALSALVFVGALLLFVTWPGYGNATFFTLVAMTAFDALAGFIITAVTARRDVELDRA